MASKEKEAIRKTIEASKYYTELDDRIGRELEQFGEDVLGNNAKLGIVLLQFTYRTISEKALMLTYKYNF